MNRYRTLTAITCLVLLLSTGLGADEPKRMSGQGGFPLTDSVTSMWGAIDELSSKDRPKPLTFIIYFVGAPGWHKGKWSSSFELAKNPAFIEYSGPVLLRAEFDRDSHSLRVFGRDISVLDSNVVVVQGVDDAQHLRVIAVGRVDLNIPADANPAVYVIQQHENIRDAVFPKGK